MDKIRVGLLYYSAGQRIVVEAGFQTIGHTVASAKYGQQIFWFSSVAMFEKYRKDIFESPMALNKPVPVFEVLEGEQKVDFAGVRKLLQGLMVWLKNASPEDTATVDVGTGEVKALETVVVKQQAPAVTPVAAQAPVPPAFLPPLLPPAPVAAAMPSLEEIFTKHAGRNIRIKEFATELGVDSDALQAVIESDPRYAPMMGGWVRVVK